MTSPIVLWTTVLEPQIWRYVVILQSLMGPYLDECADDSRHTVNKATFGSESVFKKENMAACLVTNILYYS